LSDATLSWHAPPVSERSGAAQSAAPAVQAQHVTHFEENLELHAKARVHKEGAPWPELPDYQIVEVLGEGGMGIVFKARQVSLKRTVALKMIGAGRMGAGTRRRFQIEAETIARLHHPNIVQIYEVGEYEGRPYLALEYADGGTLLQYLAATGPLPVRQAVEFAAQLAQAMHYAHGQGVVHRDLKPANILLVSGGVASGEWSGSQHSADGSPTSHHAKITDFGLAKLLDHDQSRTRSGAILGTPAYMAPEQAGGQGEAIGPRTDVYALGAILYEMLTGQPPFFGHTSWELLTHIMRDEPVPPSRRRRILARDLDTICLTALAKDPGRRYTSAGALAADLQRFAAGESIEARPERGWQRLVRRIRKHPVLLATFVLLTGAAVLAAAFLFQQRAEAKQALREGHQLRQRGDFENALVRLEQGHERVQLLPGCADLDAQLLHEWNGAQRDQFVFQLHELAEELRSCRDPESLPPQQIPALAQRFRALWRARERLLALGDKESAATWQREVLLDLYDVAVLGLALELYLAREPEGVEQVHRDAMQIVGELNQHQVPVSALARERRYHAEQLGLAPVDEPNAQPISPWDHYLVGRLLLSTGRWSEAGPYLQEAIRLDPGRAIFYFEAGICAMRQANYGDARHLFTVYIALKSNAARNSPRGTSPAPAWDGYYNRGMAEMALRQWTDADVDFTEATRQNPDCAAAYLNRGAVHRERGEVRAALNDLLRALKMGVCPAKVHYNLALTYWDAEMWSQALQHVCEARQFPNCPDDAARLERELQKKLSERDSSEQ
jgi:tetratricopeptide (TPR) repeat protein